MSNNKNNGWSNKAKSYFLDVVLNKENVDKVGLSDKPIPSFVVDWLVSKYSDGNDIDINAINVFIEKYLPEKSMKEEIKHKLMKNGSSKLLDSLKVKVDLVKSEYKAKLSSIGLDNLKINESIINDNPIILHGDTWGQVNLLYKIGDQPGKSEVWVNDFKIMQTGVVDLDYYIENREKFTLEEWIDLLIASIGYDPNYYSFEAKKYMLMRLVPMVQPRVNIIELAPKGTGKSTIFSKFSSSVWLISGGIVTRAQLFFNMKDKVEGILSFYDVIVLDEVQTIKFSNPGEIIGALKGYLQSGEYRVMGHRGTAESGLVILANIKIGIDGKPVNKFVLKDLPDFLQETAFIDRFHGLIPGWELPRIEKKSLVSKGYVLRTDYLSKVFHLFREKNEYNDYVKQHVKSLGDIRDVRSVEQISAGLLKLLYPDLKSIGSIENFEKFCVEPAKELRQLVREQMSIKDSEYKLEIADIDVV